MRYGFAPVLPVSGLTARHMDDDAAAAKSTPPGRVGHVPRSRESSLPCPLALISTSNTRRIAALVQPRHTAALESPVAYLTNSFRTRGKKFGAPPRPVTAAHPPNGLRSFAFASPASLPERVTARV